MTAPDEPLTPDSSDDLAAELAFALRFQGRKPVEIIARVPHHHRGSRRERMLSPATERKRTKRASTQRRSPLKSQRFLQIRKPARFARTGWWTGGDSNL